MAHINRIKIVGLAGRKETVEMSLDRHVNIFFGHNGCGKTSLLKLLNSAMADDAGEIGDVEYKTAEVEVFSVTLNRSVTRTCRKGQGLNMFTSLIGTDIPSESKNRWTSGDYEVAGLEHTYLPTSRLLPSELLRSEGNFYFPASAPEVRGDAAFAAMIERQWVNYSAGIQAQLTEIQERGIGDFLEIQLIPPAGRIAEAQPGDLYKSVKSFWERRTTRNFPLSLIQFTAKYRSTPSTQRFIQKIAEIETEIQAILAPQRLLREIVETQFLGGKHLDLKPQTLSVTRKPDEMRIPLAGLSAGEKHLLYIFLSALSTGENAFIIDEPELSLHIQWQRILIESLRKLNPKLQLIIATHSPDVMASVSEDNIQRL